MPVAKVFTENNCWKEQYILQAAYKSIYWPYNSHKEMRSFICIVYQKGNNTGTARAKDIADFCDTIFWHVAVEWSKSYF